MNSFDPRYMQLQQEKLDQIVKNEQRVSAVARELRVSRKTVYIWLKRYKRYGIDGLKPQRRKGGSCAHNRTSQDIEQRVIAIAKQHYTEGVGSIADRLYADQKITLHPTTIYRILKRNGVRYGPYHQHTKKRWKKKLYAHKTPGQELQMDTTYPYGYKAGKVVYTIIDDASRWVYVQTYDKANAYNTVLFLLEVFKRSPFLIKKIRTDNGTEFTNTAVKLFLKTKNITHRRNTPYCPEENGKIERFHGTLKRAYAYGLPYKASRDEFQYRLTLFVQYYNNEKRHRGLGMNGLTPIQKLEEYTLSPTSEKSVTLTLQCHNS